jgi:hypothetical protein
MFKINMNAIYALCHVTNSVLKDHLAGGEKCSRCGNKFFGGGVINGYRYHLGLTKT